MQPCAGYLYLSPTPVASIGINYGQIADNLPSPEHVVPLVKSIGVTKVKLYDADSRVLRAFADTGVEFIVGLGNEYLAKMRDPDKAKSWVKSNVQAYWPATNITCIAVGNEVLTFNDSSLTDNLLPAMQSLHGALVTLGLDKQVMYPYLSVYGDNLKGIRWDSYNTSQRSTGSDSALQTLFAHWVLARHS